MKVNHVACAIIAGALFFYADSASAMTPESSALFEKLGVKLSDNDLNRVSELYNFWNQKGGAIWPGVNISTFPIQIVFPEKYNILVGHPNPPKDCAPASFSLPVLNKAFCCQPDKTFMHGAMSGVLNKVPTLSINTMDTFDEYASDLMRKQNPKAEKYIKPYLLYLGELLHETFHAYQKSESRFLPEAVRAHKPLKLTKIDYPYQDEDNCLLLGLEGKILADLLDEKDPRAVAGLWEDFVAVRNKRHDRLPAEIVQVERFMELKEGTAQYVGWSLQYGKNNDVKPLPETLLDPRYAGYSSTDTLKDTMKQALAQLPAPNLSRWMLYVYYTGAALAYNLDKAVPGWKTDTFRKLDGLDTGLDTLLLGKVPPLKNAKSRLNAIYKKYDADALRKQIKDALAKDLSTNKQKLEGFRSAAGKHYKFHFSGANPEDVVIMGPVLLTEYKEERVFEAGAGKVLWINADWDTLAEVNFSKALPVMINRKSGEIEVIVPDNLFVEPKIISKTSKNSPGKTVYSEDVEFSNGLWDWKGGKLEVISAKDSTTLVFYPAIKK